MISSILRRGVILPALAVALLWPARLAAIIFYFTGDPAHNTTAPGGQLAGSGWQWVGFWGGFQGTVISRHHFLAARHVGGTVGDPFVFGGVSYRTIAFADDPKTDLRIVAVDGDFQTWAPLYRGRSERGRFLVVFGRGVGRGAEVRVNNTLKGWQWGGPGGVLRWGENSVAGIVNYGAERAEALYAQFSPFQGENGCQLAAGDSSGPVFIDDDGYKLAGVACAVDGRFSLTGADEGFDASIYDARGLYVGSKERGWKYIAGPMPVHSGFYATRVAVRTDWIDSVVNTPVVPAVPAAPPPAAEEASPRPAP